MKLSFAQSIKKCDMVGIAVPTTIGFIVAPLVRYLYSKPIFFIVRVDRRQLPKHEFNNYPIKKHITQAVFSVYDFFVRQMLKTKKVIMFTFGEALMEDYANKIGRNSVFALHPAIPTELISMHNSMISEVENILYVGRLAKEKGINNLLKAFAEIKKKPEIVEDSLTLNIVGLGSEEKYLKAKVNQLKISTSVKFHGFIPPGTNLWRLYDQSQIFVLPSYTESLARVLYEAMARGVAVITTNVGGIPFKVKDGENGLLVRPGDVKGLKNAILRLIQDRELRSLLVTKGYKTVLEVTFEKQGKIMVDILRHRFYRFLNEED
jgi:glycosyltransferase involved in cell wall biosynthesis